MSRVSGTHRFSLAGRVASVIVGLLLILLADQVAKRKRAAWQIALALFAAGAVAHLLKGPQPLAVAFCVAMLAALLLARKQFRAPVDPPSLLRLARFVPLHLGVVLAFGLVTLYIERRALTPELTMGGAVFTVLGGLVGVDGPYTYVRPFFAAFFPAALLALGVTGLVVFVVLLFRPLAARGPHTADIWKRAEDLVHRYGWDTLAYFALREDKSFFFGSDGQAMLAYTYLGGYALVSGDPIGAPASVPRVLDEFLAVATNAPGTPLCSPCGRPTGRCTRHAGCEPSTSVTRPSCAATASASPAGRTSDVDPVSRTRRGGDQTRRGVFRTLRG